jgi:hypothetical protein
MTSAFRADDANRVSISRSAVSENYALRWPLTIRGRRRINLSIGNLPSLELPAIRVVCAELASRLLVQTIFPIPKEREHG